MIDGRTLRLAGLVLLLAGTAPAFAADGPLRRASPASYRPSLCDRKAVGACQAEARRTVELCTPFKGQRACAGYALSDLQSCWAATGCY